MAHSWKASPRPRSRARFSARWPTRKALTAQSLLDVIANTMPQSDPGSLKPEDMHAVTAYILQQNGYPAGTAPLANGAAGMKDAKITP